MAPMDEARAIELVRARLRDLGQAGFTYPVVGAREHANVWAIAVQPTRPDGAPLYGLMGFDVDKATGEVRHML